MILRVGLLTLLLGVFAAVHARAADTPPSWLREAAARSAMSTSGNATVLLDEELVAAGADGRLTRTRRYAISIRTLDARDAAAAREVYLTDSGRIRDTRGWVIHPDGTATTLGRSGILDLAATGSDTYNEVRVRVVTARDQVDAGAVFGAEIVSEETALFRQIEWTLSRRWPVRAARRTLTLPAGWTASSITFGAAAVEPKVIGTTYTWEINDVARLEPEPSGPPESAVTPRVCVSYGPAGTTAFNDWKGVSQWLFEIGERRAAVTPEIDATARRLVGDAADPLEQVRRIARFVQSLQYVSIQIGVGRGGGYQPHAASEVLAKRYGDCKDKANLMRALLNAAGIRSFLLTVYATDPGYVRGEWPSPQQFNHCILAIQLSAANVGSTISHPRLGTLLIFDATDPYTPVGMLPADLLGSRGLIVANDPGPLVTLPTVVAEAPEIHREATVVLAASGGAAVTQQDRASGAAATLRHALLAEAGPDRFARRLQARTASAVPGAAQIIVKPVNDPADITIEYQVPSYAQTIGALLVARPALLREERLPDVSMSARKTPLLIERQSSDEQLTMYVPRGFRLDELPADVHVETTFGEFTRTCKLSGSLVVITRRLRLENATITPPEYESVKQFVRKVHAADAAALVFAAP